jgi:hypothetical protein
MTKAGEPLAGVQSVIEGKKVGGSQMLSRRIWEAALDKQWKHFQLFSKYFRQKLAA